MRLKKVEREFIAFQRVCRVATVSRKGTPHNVPVCPILDGDRIYFASAADGVKVRNIQATGKVALAFDELRIPIEWDQLAARFARPPPLVIGNWSLVIRS